MSVFSEGCKMHVYECSWIIYGTHRYVLDGYVCVCSQAGD
jgi:hypothetical protein